MEQKKTNQERSRKAGGSSSFVDMGQPSRATRQDEDGKDAVGFSHRTVRSADGESANQGISNRPAKDEHAFPPTDESASERERGTVEEGPSQVGGNRGRV